MWHIAACTARRFPARALRGAGGKAVILRARGSSYNSEGELHELASKKRPVHSSHRRFIAVWAFWTDLVQKTRSKLDFDQMLRHEPAYVYSMIHQQSAAPSFAARALSQARGWHYRAEPH